MLIDASPSNLIERFLPELQKLISKGPVLDLACGYGRNGWYLCTNDIPVVFADRNQQALEEIELNITMEAKECTSKCWYIDLENGQNPLPKEYYSAVIVFHYLYRPLLPYIKESITPGGMIIYETFTEEQRELGRPKNPDFLLKPHELQQAFTGWQFEHTFEGITTREDTLKREAIAQVVAYKPEN